MIKLKNRLHKAGIQSFPQRLSFPRKRESTSQSTPALSSPSFPRKRESSKASRVSLDFLGGLNWLTNNKLTIAFERGGGGGSR